MNNILATNSGTLTLTYTNGTWVLYDSGRDLSVYANSNYYIQITDTNGSITNFKIGDAVGGSGSADPCILVGGSSGGMPDKVLKYDLDGILQYTYTDILPPYPDRDFNAIIDIIKVGDYLYATNFYQYGIYQLDLFLNWLNTLDLDVYAYPALSISSDGTFLYVVHWGTGVIKKRLLSGLLVDTWEGSDRAALDVIADTRDPENIIIYCLLYETTEPYKMLVVKRNVSGDIIGTWYTGDNVFESAGICIDSEGYIWTTDEDLGYINKFDSDGVLINNKDVYDDVGWPIEIGTDSQNYVYVLGWTIDPGWEQKIGKYDSSMNLIDIWSVTIDGDMYAKRLCVIDESDYPGVCLHPVSGMLLKITEGASISINIDGTAIEIDGEGRTIEEIVNLLVDAINNADLGVIASEDLVLDNTIIINGSDGDEHTIEDGYNVASSSSFLGFDTESIVSFAITEGPPITDMMEKYINAFWNLLPKGKLWNRV